MMKKSKKLSIGLVTSFIGALALTACSEPVTESDKSVVDFIGYNSEDESLAIDTDAFYSKYGDSDEGTTLYYNSVLESLIRYEYKPLSERSAQKDPANKQLKAYSTVEKEANDKVTAQKQTATDNAKSNKTSYSDEWDKILESYDVEDEDELKDYFLYEIEKDAINEWYYKQHADENADQYIGLKKDWSEETTEGVDSVYPYHILHVLVKLSADAGDYTRATISEAEAKKLWSVVRNLMDSSYTFEKVAYDLSDDTSNKDYGDVGIMSINTSFYNEFKLGIYAYDALLSGVNEEAGNEHIFKAFGLDSESSVIKTVVNNGGKANEENWMIQSEAIPETMVKGVHNAVTGYDRKADGHYKDGYSALPTIPYDVFRRIGLAAEKDKLSDNTEPDSGDVVLPRNVLFNQFLNFRSPFVITDEDFKALDGDDKILLESHNFTTPVERAEPFDNNFKLKATNFRNDKVPALGTKNVLCDQDGNVIIGVRSSAGIHFMVMRKSIFKGTNEMNGKAGEGYTLQDYYTVREDIDAENYPEETYVNMANAQDPSYYTNRINTIKNKFKGSDSSDAFDAAYDYRIYEMLLNDDLVKGKITIEGTDFAKSKVAENIDKKISLLREMHTINNAQSMNDAWDSYLAQLRNQNDMREYEDALVHTTCVFKFDNDPDAFSKDKGGICYVK